MKATERPFLERLALARKLIRDQRAEPFQSRADRRLIEGATTESRDLLALIGHAGQQFEPWRTWRSAGQLSADGDQHAYLLAALLGCRACGHLRRMPQPAIARLAIRRIECQRCMGTLRLPPPDGDNVCDVCGEGSAEPWWTPFLVQCGPTLVGGDACTSCAEALRIPVAERVAS